MSIDLQISDRELREWRRIMFRFPREFKRASANTLNAYAFGTRKIALRNIKREMHMRNTRFVQGRVQVQKALGYQPIGAQYSEVGSVAAPRFTGWEEQESGAPASNKGRFATLLGRGGAEPKQITGQYRFKPGRTFDSPNDIRVRDTISKRGRVIKFLYERSHGRKRKPFLILGHPGFVGGLYKFKAGGRRYGRKLQLLQGIHQRAARVRRVRWMSAASDKYLGSVDPYRVWERALMRALPR